MNPIERLNAINKESEEKNIEEKKCLKCRWVNKKRDIVLTLECSLKNYYVYYDDKCDDFLKSKDY